MKTLLPALLLAAAAPAQSFFDTFAYPGQWFSAQCTPGTSRRYLDPSPGGRFRKLCWRGPHCDYDPAGIAAWSQAKAPATYLTLAVTPAGSGPARGAAIATDPRYGEGTCRVRFWACHRPGNTMARGVTNGLYLECAGGEVIGLELNSRYQGLIGYRRGVAQVSLDRPGTAGDHSRAVTLFFDPSWGYHTFGIGRRPGAVEFTVDGMVIHRFAAAAVGPLPAGKARLVLANWTGDPARAGQPPQKATYLLVDWLSWTPVHFTADRRDVPVGAGGRTTMRLDAGPAAAGTTYLVALSTRATSAGTPLAGGATLPLDPDPVGLALTLLAMQPGPPFTGFFGTLSAGGGASPDFMLPAGLPPALAGTTFHFACFAPFAPAPFVAGPLSVTIR